MDVHGSAGRPGDRRRPPPDALAKALGLERDGERRSGQDRRTGGNAHRDGQDANAQRDGQDANAGGRPANSDAERPRADGPPAKADAQGSATPAKDGQAGEGLRASGATSARKKGIVRVVVVVAALTVIAAAALWWLHARKFEGTDDAQLDADISAVGARVAGTVTAVHVQDNQQVQAGALLVELDPTDLQVALSQARAALAQAEAASRLARTEKARAQQLLQSRSIPQAQYDQRASAAATSAAAVEVARARLQEAENNVRYGRIVAPVAGIVGKKSVNVGDRVQPGQQLVSITQVGRVWVTANFRETQLKQIKPGQSVSVHVDALDHDYTGKVASIAGATGARYSLLPPENATGNYVKVVQRVPVRIELDPGQPGLERLRPGMSAEPEVRVR